MQVNGNTNRSIYFGAFELKPVSGELLCNGVSVKLPPQPFKVLVVLAENAGLLVAREEIQRQVWGDDTFVDFDKGLNFCIKQIREALSDNAQSPRYIETLPRRGYRFIAPVEKPPVANSVNGSAVDTTSATPSELSIINSPLPTEGQLPQPVAAISTTSHRSLTVGRQYKWGIAIAVLAALSIYPLWRYLKPQSSSPAGKKMLVVLPFENLNADTNEDYFNDGLTEEMITQLGRLQPRKLGVIARTTALTYKKTPKDIRQIGQELGVNYVLEGSVRRQANLVRITAQLIQVSDQTHLWSETYERSERDMLQIQSEVARRVANSLALELFPTSPKDSTGAASVNPEAYDAYLKGRFLVTKDTLPDLERSIPYFDQATEKDPSFAPAYAAAVDARMLLSTWNNTFSAEVLNRAKADALKAVELDPALGEAYAALGAVNFWFEWNWSEAEKNIKRGIELNPSNPNSHILYADFLLSQGETEAAVSHIQQAIELDPVSLLTNGLAAFFYLRARHCDDAITQAQRMLELEPKSPAAKDCLISAYRYKGMYQEMLEVKQKRVSAEGNRKAIPALNQGDAKEAIERIERNQLKELKDAVAKGEKRNALWAAHLAAQLGEKDLALEWLEKACEEHLPYCIFINIQQDFDSLRQDHRFTDITRRMELSR
jgi:TolB-like protein/DNA-binding winged helix-turn-helix (wHTH) protein/Tfp pilus assembly protein PilF